jgi:hypothetical protein
MTMGLINHFKTIWHVDHAGFLIWNGATSSFELFPTGAFDNQIIAANKEIIGRADFLVKTLETERRLFPYGIAVDDELLTLVSRSSPGERATFQKIRRTMRWLGAAVCVPLMLNDDLVGFFVLGPKKNRMIYNDEDKKFLAHVAELVSDTIKGIILSQPVDLTKLSTEPA